MTEMQKLAYEATLERLREAFPEDRALSLKRAAAYLQCRPYNLTKHKAFLALTFGDSHKSITLENLALWECRIGA